MAFLWVGMLSTQARNNYVYSSDRLSSSMIISIFQDYHGFLWLGTEYGLNRFDGYRYINYLHDRKDSTSLVDNTVVSFMNDSQHNLWIGTNRGLVKFNYASNDFRTYHFPHGVKPRVTAMVESDQGDIYIGTSGYYGIYVLRKGKSTIEVAKEFGVRDENFVYYLFQDDKKNLWKCNHLTSFGYYQMRHGKPAGFKAFESSVGPINKFHQLSDGRILIVCLYGILEYNYNTGKLKKADYVLPQLSGNLSIRSSYLDSKGNLYIGIKSLGLMVIPAGKQRAEVVKGSNAQVDLSRSNVVAIFEDRTQNLWIGTYDQGAYIVNEQQTAFKSWEFLSQNYMVSGSTTALVPGDNGDVWCAVRNNGIYHFDGQGNIVGHPNSPVGTNFLYRDRQGDCWISTENVLFSYNPMTGASQRKAKFEGWGIYGIADDGKGNLYVSNFGKGFYIYNKYTGRTINYNMNQKGRLGHLWNDWIESLIVDRQGLVWMATMNGLSCFDPATGSFRPWGWLSQLEGLHCTHVYESDRYGILVGTDAGLYHFNAKTKRVENFPHSEVMEDKKICAIVEDKKGELWISTSMGIWEYNPKSKKFIAHMNGNGLVTREYTLNAALTTKDGMIGFGTGDGLTVFYPDVVRSSHVEMGDIYLTNFIVGDKYVDFLSNKFEIPYSENSFSMEFSLLNFRNADNTSFEYSLNGGKWISTAEGTNRIFFYRLKPGKYTIRVRAVNNGVVSEKCKVLTVVVNNPWYATWWAYLIYALIIGGIIFMIVLYYMRRKRVEMEESKMRFLINATHDIRSPLTLILGPLKKLKDRLTDPDTLADLDIIDRNAQRLLLLVNQILDRRKIDMKQMHLHCSETDLVELIMGIKSLFQYNATQRDITLRLIHDSHPYMVWIDKNNFDKVVSNLLSNAFKFTPDGGEITITLEEDANSVRMIVQDNGPGFQDEHPDRFFDRFYQGNGTPVSVQPGTGIGLNLCRSIVHMHGGTIKAANRSDGHSGACFTVELPKGNKHLKPEQMAETRPDGRVKQTPAYSRPNRNLKVALVDDDLELAQYIKKELSNWFYMDIFPNGSKALQALLVGDYDAVVSDIIMPEMDGVTLLKNIKNNTQISDLPVILLTSKSEVKDRLKGIKEGADAYISKPFNIDELRLLIVNHVDNVRRLRGKFSGAQSQDDTVENIEVKGNNDLLMDRIMKSINSNLSNPDFNVEMLMGEVGISRTQLHRKMKEITGISAGGFIRNIRLQQAARLIKEKKQNVTQIAYAVGFNSQTHFSSAFKKHFGMTPSEYANQEDTGESNPDQADS